MGLAHSRKKALLEQLLGLLKVAIKLGLGFILGGLKGGQLIGRGREFLISLLGHLL